MENINIEILISEVQQREPLWNPKHAGYRNTLVQQRLWDELGASMKMNGMFDRLSYRKYTDRVIPVCVFSALFKLCILLSLIAPVVGHCIPDIDQTIQDRKKHTSLSVTTFLHG